MQTAKEAREARRKRILERGSDRLAYITRDTTKQHSLKSPPLPPPPPLRQQDGEEMQETSLPRIVADNDGSAIASQGANTEVSVYEGGQTQSTSDLQPSTTSRTLADFLNMGTESTTTSSEASPTRAIASNKTPHNYLNRLAISIDTSEKVRAMMAVIVGLVVVSTTIFSCCGHPWGARLSVLLPSWPISLVLLTDLTLVVGAFIMRVQIHMSSKGLGADEALSIDKFSRALDVMGRVEKLLGISLLCKKAGGAIVLDCSIYAVTLVCGLCIGRHILFCCDSFL